MTLERINWDIVERDLLFGDGHTIFGPEFYREAGFSLDWLPIQQFKSDRSSPKTTIFNEDGVVEECQGVHHLDFLRKLARELKADLDTHRYPYGRGSEARFLVERIRKVLPSKSSPQS